MDGVLAVDKPQGLTSHDVVSVARRILKERRIGHTGTLDPIATGVLPLACGRATRLVRFLSASDKDYTATILFGLVTDTYDVTGQEVRRSGRQPGREQLVQAVASLIGEYDQMPPAYSAKKVGGRRAYDLARQDADVVLTPVPVRVSRADILSFTGDRATVALTCSSGFYVRSFCYSVGELVGTGACLEQLQRTRSGDFRLEAAATLDALLEDPDLAPGWMIPMDSLLSSMPSASLTDEGRMRASHGQEIEDRHVSQGTVAPETTTGAWVRLLDEQGRLIAVGRQGQRAGSLHPAVVLI
jgi:tRNA pseudouridine55 synthase